MNPCPFDRPIAHRGLHDRSKGIIENSGSAFEAAIERGFGIECDLQLTADGEAMLFHDPALQRLTGFSGRVRETKAAQLRVTPLLDSASGDCPQTFEDFLEQVGGRTPLVVEIKQQATRADGREIAARAATLAAGYIGPLVFKSFDPTILMALRRSGYKGPLGIITYRYDLPEWYGDMPAHLRFVLRHLLHWPWSRFTFVSCERTALSLPAVSLSRALGMKVTSWTIKSPEEAAEALERADQIVFEGFDPEA